LFVFPGCKQPEDKKGKQDQPGQSDQIMDFDGGSKAQEVERAMYFKSGNQQNYDNCALQPVPETLVASIQIYVNHF
jgi:hypothetical protein